MAHIVSAVQECFESEALCERMERWMAANAGSIDVGCKDDIADGIGLPHRYAALHTEWVNLVESALESAVEDAGGTIQEFYEAYEMRQQGRPDNIGGGGGSDRHNKGNSDNDTAAWARDTSFLSLVNATVSFDFWLDVMIDTALALAQEGKETDRRDISGSDAADRGQAHRD